MKKNTKEKEDSINKWVNVKDIKDIFIQRRDNVLISIIRIYSLNIDLMSKEERDNINKQLSCSFESDRKDFAYVSYPREVDLDFYTNDLKKIYNEATKSSKRKLIKNMLLEGIKLATNGENFEHQQYIKLWQPVYGDISDSESTLRNRVEEFMQRYESVGVHTDCLDEQEIIKVCNLFGNAIQAPYLNVGDNTLYEPLTRMK